MDEFICCLEDVEIAIDDFVNEYETFPILEDHPDGICDYCRKPSRYILKKPESLEENGR
jgi:CxxH/CxxC protein (TIGR04129 family)